MLLNNTPGAGSGSGLVSGASLLPESKSLEDVRPDECVEIWWLEQLRIHYASVHGYLGLAVCLFGVLSNLVNIVVLTRRHMLSSTNILLCALAIANAAKMLSFIPVYAHFYLVHAEEDLFLTRSDDWIHYLLVQITLGSLLANLARSQSFHLVTN